MAPAKLESGTRIDARYLLTRRLGAGGFGEVWLALDELDVSLSRPIALKILHPRLLEASDVVRERFEQEAEILARLDHPSIVRPIAFRVTDERAYLAMEYVEGYPLDRVLKTCSRRNEYLDPDETVRVFDELAAAVHYLHEEGVVHRDLKPSNVMFVRRGGRVFVKLLDLGIARLLGVSGRDATTLGRVMGSFHYAAPEQIRGERAEVASDVFALGVILFELVTTRRAFVLDDDGGHATADSPPLRSPVNSLPRVAERIRTGPRPKPSDAREGVPLEIDRIVAQALAIDPAQRHSSAAELAAEAVAVLRDLATTRGTTIFALAEQLEQPEVEPPSAPTATQAEMETAVTLGDGGTNRATVTVATMVAFAAAAIIGGYIVTDTRHDENAPLVKSEVVEPPPRPRARPSVTERPPVVTTTVSKPEPVASAPAPAARPARSAPPPPATKSALTLLVERAREEPTDLARVAALGDAVRAALRTLPQGPQRTRLERRTETSAMDGDVEGLAACVRALETINDP